jgi:cytochrome c551/c552
MSKRKMVLIIVAALVVIQIPAWFFQTNPPVVAEPNWDSPQTRALAQRACFDCHSNETVWPWYSRIAPASWLVTLDTIRGRGHLNFSDWNVASSNDRRGERGAGEVDRVIANGSMPPASYVMLHPNAQLTAAEKQQLIDGLQASLK